MSTLDRGQPGSPRPGTALSAYARRYGATQQRPWDPLTQRSDARIAELAGAPPQTVRALQELPAYQDRVAAAEAFGDIQTEPPKGAVMSALQFIDRPRSAIVGAVSGLLGKDRQAIERRGVEEDLVEKSTIGTAVRRFWEGLSGQDQFFFSDFGVIGSRPDDDANIVSRGFNAVGGFVLDTVFDPLTYASFGGSIWGRRIASEMVQAASEKSLRGAVGQSTFNPDTLIMDALAKRTHDQSSIRNKIIALQKAAFEEGGSQARLAGRLGKITSDRAFNDILRATPNAWKRKLALDIAPDVAAGTYAGYGGAKATRRWAINMFGSDAGEAYFRSLPRDLQGGLRIRLPFVRDASGNVISFPIVPGVGAGRLSEKSQTVAKLVNLTDDARDFVGHRMKWLLERMSGARGNEYFNYVAAARGRIDKNGAVTYEMYRTGQQAVRRMAQVRQTFDDQIVRNYVQSDVMYTDGLEKYGDDFAEAWRLVFYRTLTKPENVRKLAAIQRKIGKEGVELASDVARIHIDLVESIGGMHIEAFGDARRAFNVLRDYGPRVPTSDEAIARILNRSGVQTGTSASYMKHRSMYAGALYLDEDGATGVIRWLDPKGSNEFAALMNPDAKAVYMTDPREFFPIWIQENRSNLIDQYVTDFYIKSGIFTKAEKVYDTTIIKSTTAWQRYFQLRGQGLPGDEGFQPGLFDQIVKQLDGETNFIVAGQRRAPESLVTRPEIAAAERISKIFSDNGIPGIVFRADFDQYIPLDLEAALRLGIVKSKTAPDVEEILARHLYNPWDGTLIENVGTANVGSFRVVNASKQDLIGQLFGTAQEAELAAQSVFMQLRDNNYFDWSAATVSQFREMVDNAYLSTPRNVVALLDPENLDPTDKPAHLKQIIEHIMDVLDKTGRIPGKAKVTGGGRMALIEPSVLDPQEVVTQPFLDYLQSTGYTNIQGADFARGGVRVGPAGASDVRTRVAVEFADYYAPREVMNSLNEMFRAYKDPGNEFLKFYQDVYQPYYRAAKVWMTLGRGPGFVVRNIHGGMWNLHIGQVGFLETSASADILGAQMNAQARVAKKFGKDFAETRPMDAFPEFQREMGDILRQKHGKKSGTYIDGMNDADALMEIFELMHMNGLDSGRETSRLLGTILDSGRDRMGYPLLLQRKRGGKMVTDRVDMAASGAQVQRAEEMTKYQRAIYLATDGNPWIRGMSKVVGNSEDFLRTAAFIGGIRRFGLEPAESGIRGYRASLMVKATQFDYSDLSAFERDVLKAILPFYTWSRYNLPMQIRHLLYEPGKVAQAVRINDEMARMWAEENEDGYPYASYVQERFGWVVPGERFNWLPQWLRPDGDVSMGLVWGEPVADVNRLFRTPGAAVRNLGPSNFILQAINTREMGQNLNPILPAVFSAWGGAAYASDPGVMPGDREKAMGWLRLIGWQRDPQTGDMTASRAIADSIRAIFPMVGLLERNVPQVFGGERQQGRQFTSLVGSSLLGLPTATEDDWKAASEMRRRSQFIKQQIDQRYGKTANTRMEAVRQLRAAGAGPEEIALFDIGNVPDDLIDVGQLVGAFLMLRRINYMREAGVSEQTILAALSAFVPDDVKVSSAEEILRLYYRSSQSDRARRIREFGVVQADEDALRQMGLSAGDIAGMTREEREIVVRRVDPRL